MPPSRTSHSSREPGRGPHLESRLVAVETSVETIERDIKSQGVRLDNLADAVRDGFDRIGRPDWQVLIGAVGLVVLLVSAIGGAALAPLYLMHGYDHERLTALGSWQEDFSRGKLPSPLEPKLAALEKQLSSIEQQGRYTAEAADVTRTRQRANEELINRMDERLKLTERAAERLLNERARSP